MNRELEEILGEDIFTIKNTKEVFIESETGLPKPEILDYEKSKFIKESMEHLKNEILVANYDYPTHFGINYKFNLDCVIIRRKDYDRIKAILETYE